MERRATLLSVGLSFLAMYLVYQYVSGEEEKLRKDYTVFYPVVVATRDILQYETIRPTDIEVLRVPQAVVAENRVENPRDVIDAVAAIPISKGEHVLDNKIISKNIYSGLDTQIAMERRAISIPVSVKSSVGYMVRPGNRVDLSAHFDYKAQGVAISEVKTFLQDLLVLAAGRTIQANPPKAVDQDFVRNILSDVQKSAGSQFGFKEVQENLNYAKQDSLYQTVTLEVTPEQAQQVFYVLTVYPDSLTLILRNADDRVLDRPKTTNLYDVMGENSYYVRGNKVAPQKAVPRAKYYDYVGAQQVPVY